MKEFVRHEFVPPNTTVNSDFTVTFDTLERKYVMRKTGTLAQPQLVPLSQQRACLHVPENHRVCD
jgi:hypothetical protein